MSQLAEVVKSRRIKAGYTQRALAEKLGVDFTYISKIENDKTEYPPSEEVLKKMAVLLSVDEEWLIFSAGKIPSAYTGLLAELALKYGKELPVLFTGLLKREPKS